MKIKGNVYSCELTAADSVRCSLELPVRPDTAVYAVKRFITHSPVLRRACTCRSYRLRIGEKRSYLRTLKFEAPARLLELPGASIRVTLQVSQRGVAVAAVSLYAARPCDGFRILP